MRKWKYRLTVFNLGTRWIKPLGIEIKHLYENHESSAAHCPTRIFWKKKRRYGHYGVSPPNTPIQGSEEK
jgi:hypothetical protein